MNLINIENILISNFLFLYFYLTGGIITTRYIKGNSLIKNFKYFFGITLFITFLSIINFLSNFSINLSYLIILYSVGIIFFLKKNFQHIFFLF